MVHGSSAGHHAVGHVGGQQRLSLVAVDAADVAVLDVALLRVDARNPHGVAVHVLAHERVVVVARVLAVNRHR